MVYEPDGLSSSFLQQNGFLELRLYVEKSLRRELKVVSGLFVRGSCFSSGCRAQSGTVVGMLLLGCSQESLSGLCDPIQTRGRSPPPQRGSCCILCPLQTAMQNLLSQLGKLFVQMMLLGMLEASQDPVPPQAALVQKTSSSPSLIQLVLWLILIIEGTLERQPVVSWGAAPMI